VPRIGALSAATNPSAEQIQTFSGGRFGRPLERWRWLFGYLSAGFGPGGPLGTPSSNHPLPRQLEGERSEFAIASHLETDGRLAQVDRPGERGERNSGVLAFSATGDGLPLQELASPSNKRTRLMRLQFSRMDSSSSSVE
jgi:hypothetical protein